MNSFKKLAVAGFLGATLTASMACGIQSAVNDVQNGLKEAAKTAVAQKGFQSAVSDVTVAIVKQALKSGQGAPAPAPQFTPLATQTQTGTFDINDSATVDGGSIKTTGKITYTSTMDDVTYAMKFDMTMDLQSTFTGMKFKDDSGKELTSDGDFKVGGEFHSEVTGQTFKFNGKLTQKGSITIEGTKYDIDITVTLTETSATYTGTINGQPVNGTFSMTEAAGTDDAGQGEAPAAKSCGFADHCIDYVGADAATVVQCASNGGQESPDVCPTMGVVASCQVGATSATEYDVRYFGTFSSADVDCTNLGGTYTPAP